MFLIIILSIHFFFKVILVFGKFNVLLNCKNLNKYCALKCYNLLQASGDDVECNIFKVLTKNFDFRKWAINGQLVAFSTHRGCAARPYQMQIFK